MFNRYLHELFENKITLLTAILLIPIIIYNCMSDDWLSENFFNPNNEQTELEEIVPQIPECPKKEEIKEEVKEEVVTPENPEENLSDIDKAYLLIKEEISKLEVDDEITLNVEKEDNSIVLIYQYTDLVSETIKNDGLSENFLLSVANDMRNFNLAMKEYVNLDVNIKAKLYDYEGNLYIYIDDDKLIELNPVYPTNSNGKPLKNKNHMKDFKNKNKKYKGVF